MGRIMWSGSPVARARTKTTTDRMARATSDCSTRTATKRITSTSPAALGLRLPLLARGQLVEEEVVHHRPRVPLAEGLRRRVGRVHVDEGHSEVLAAQPGEDVA